METPEHRIRDNLSVAVAARCAIGNALPDSLMRPSPVEVASVFASDSVEIVHAEEEYVIKRFAPKTTHESFGYGIHVRGADRRLDHSHARLSGDPIERGPELVVTVTDQRTEAYRLWSGLAKQRLNFHPPSPVDRVFRMVRRKSPRLDRRRHRDPKGGLMQPESSWPRGIQVARLCTILRESVRQARSDPPLTVLWGNHCAVIDVSYIAALAASNINICSTSSQKFKLNVSWPTIMTRVSIVPAAGWNGNNLASCPTELLTASQSNP